MIKDFHVAWTGTARQRKNPVQNSNESSTEFIYSVHHKIVTTMMFFFGCALVSALVVYLTAMILRLYSSPLLKMPFVPNSSLILGSMRDVLDEPPIWPQLRWANTIGSMLVYRTFFQLKVLPTDPEGLKRVLVTNVRNYPKMPQTRKMLSSLTGQGVLTSEGDDHARQRKLVNACCYNELFCKVKTQPFA